MEILYKQLKKKVTEDISKMEIPLSIDATKILSSTCYNALVAIRAVLNDHTLNDKECFWKIEEIVAIYETIGSDGGSRHDFG